VSEDYHVDLDGLTDAIKAMQDFETWWEQTQIRLDYIVANLHTTWLGQAATAHQQAHKAWADGSTKMRDALNKLRAAGQQAHSNYGGAAVTGHRMWTED